MKAVTVTVAMLGGVAALSGTNLAPQEAVGELARTRPAVYSNGTNLRPDRSAYPFDSTYSDEGDRDQFVPVLGIGTNSRISLSGLSRIEPVQSTSRWRDYVSLRLSRLRRGDGDFTGLTQPTEEIVRRARNVTSLFKANTPTPSVVPSEDGDILFIWQKAGWELEIEVGSEEVSAWLHERSSGAISSGSLAELWPSISSILARLALD
jgi:hypothetical protein